MTKLDKKMDVRERYKDFAEELIGCPFDKIPTDSDRSRLLAKFYINQIHNVLKNEIDDDEFDDAFVDGAGDLDIDLIHRNDNRVLILQTRYRGASAGAEKSANISRFQGVIARMRSSDFKANAKLQDILGTIDWEHDSFEFVYITFAKLTGQALDQTREEPIYPEGVPQLPERCIWEYLGEGELGVELRRAATLGHSIPDTKTELVSAGQKSKRSGVLDVKSGDYRSCVLAVEAQQLVKAYQAVGDVLFSLNIRNFLGNTKNNQKIILTARDNPEDFFYYNNGVSCLAEELNVQEDRVVARKLQVINGAQTVKGLVRAAGKLGKAATWDSHQPVVLVRITEVGSYAAAGRFREDITRFNNTQNVIRDADFKSNDSIQRDLEEKFAKIVRLGKKVSYQAKRTDTRTAGALIVRMEEFAKVVYSFLGDPVSFSGSTSMLFDDEKGYSLVFGDGNSPWVAMPPEEFKLRAGIYWIGAEFGERAQAEKKRCDDPVERAALERKWFLIYTAGLLLERAFPSDTWRARVSRLYKGDWKLGKEREGLWAEKLYGLSKSTVVLAYSQATRNPSFVHRNWMRNPETAHSLKELVKHTPEFWVAPLREAT